MATISPCTHFAILLLLLHFLNASSATQVDLVINTSHGKVQGKLLSVLGGNVRAFLGVPYGKPPLGKLRFRAPEPVEKWEGVRDATKFPYSCHQMPDTAFPGSIHVWTSCIHDMCTTVYMHIYVLPHTLCTVKSSSRCNACQKGGSFSQYYTSALYCSP